MDQVRQQWRRPVHYAHGSASACGVVILCREGTFENIVCAHQETTGRMVVVDMEKSGKKYRITNVYAPKDEKEREIVFKKIPIWCNDESLVIGDFNVVLSKKDLSAQNVYKEDASRQIIYNIMSDNNLVDIWWIKNPHKRSYSRQQIKFGIGNNFINWLKLLYNNSYSCVKCNGLITKTFQIQRSVRQGCPLSSLLYSLVAEPLTLLINQDR
uniref:Uncharacterized protein n=1 Tax=Sparus aurata TaxID=8175 RepID=A0A671VN57_SPAAU